ncbi:sensor histidine kinase [Paenibacillus sp. IB182496]|uniref:histidine kinase n=1 Tax=Paenibacillus sabuli TaxID=2772509 RepID=A0A927GQ62_9BACL|nr:sensor histidine kinase [Paenibacillus sabuli]MBD2843946.1 sensor histidine kinase [Paenibacillus sabuli]
MRHFISFKQKLILTYIVFIVLPLSVLGLGAYNLYRQAMEDKLSDFALQVSTSTAASIESYIRELERFTLQPYYSREFQDLLTLERPTAPAAVREKKETIEKNFSLWQSQRESVTRMYYFDKPGPGSESIFNQGYLPADFTVEQMPWYASFSASDENLLFLSLHRPLSEDLNAAFDEQQVFSLVRKIYKSSTMLEYAGYFEVDFMLRDIEEIMDAVHLGESGSFFIMDRDSQLIYANDPVEQALLERLPELIDGERGMQRVRDGEQRNLIVYSQIGDYGWTVVGDVPVVQIATGNSSVRNSMLILGLACIIIAILLSTLSSIQITKPIYRLIALIKRVEKEDFAIAYPNPPRNEIGHLIRSVIRMSRRLDETIRNLYQAELLRKESELQALKSQINPHFLFNTLETIKMKAELDEADSTVEMLTSLGRLVKTSIYRGNDFIRFREERDYVRSYFHIQANRYGPRFDMTVEAEATILDCYLPKLTVQPLIENAFYHGLEMKEGKGRLRVSMEASADSTVAEKTRQAGAKPERIVITVADDGLGIEAGRLQQLRAQLEAQVQGAGADAAGSGQGIGLANVYARLKLYFGESCAMTVQSEPGAGTQVVISIPIIRNESEVHAYVSRHHRG